MIRPGFSQIDGIGIFATEDIARGTLIGVMKTVPAKRNGRYVIWRGDDAFRVICELRYINHSHNPNVAVDENFAVTAIKPILTEEELTFDYGEESAVLEEFRGLIS
jgi:hypothetical protein